MQLQIVSFDAHALNDSSYAAYFPQGTVMLQGDGQPGLVERTHFAPVYTYKGRSARTLPVVIKMLGTIHSQLDTLKTWFNTFDDSGLKKLLVQDTADSNKQWYIMATCISQPRHEGQEVTFNLLVPDPIWYAETTSSVNWNVTATGATQAVSNGGTVEARPVITVSPQAAKSSGAAYRRNLFVRNASTVTLSNYPIEITNGGLNTAALVADNSNKCQINNGAGITDADTTIPYDTVTGSIPSIGKGYVDSEQLSWTGKTGTTSGNLTGCTRGINGTSAAAHLDNAEIKVSKMEADGGDIQILIDGEQSNYWLADMNTSDTEIWANFELSAGQSMTLGDTIANNGAVTAINLENSTPNGTAIEALPSRGYLLIGSEAYYYGGKDVAAKRFFNVTRAVLDTSMASHAVSDTIYWIEHTVEMQYGIHGLPAFTVDDDYKPMFNLDTSTNTSWDWDSFILTDGSEAAIQTRPGCWFGSNSVGVPITEIYVEGIQHHYTSMASARPGTQTAAAQNTTFTVLGLCDLSNTTITPCYFFEHQLGFTEVTAVDGYKYLDAAGVWWNTAPALYKGLTFVNAGMASVFSESAPATGSNVAWSQSSVSLSGTYTHLRWHAGATGSNANEASIEIDNLTMAIDSTLSPGFGTSPGEVQVYPLNARITNNTTGEYVAVAYTLPLTETVEIDTETKTVEHSEEGTNIRGSLTLSSVDFDWLLFNVGSNTLQYDETGVADVDLVVSWRDRHN